MKNDHALIFAFAGSALVVVLSVGIVKFFLTAQRKKAQQLADENRHRQEILQTQIEIQQQSFQNVSREIHDNIGQVLSLIKLNLGRVAGLTASQAYHEKILTTLDLTGQVINDLRHLSKGLNPDFVKQLGLAGCIGFELERLQNAGAYLTTLSTSGTVYPMPLSKEFVLYRVVQECLNNIIKHAHASSIAVNMNYSPGQLTIAVTDNGRGFDGTVTEHQVTLNGGSGLSNMKKRMEMIDGQLSCVTGIGKGTTITMCVNAETGAA